MRLSVAGGLTPTPREATIGRDVNLADITAELTLTSAEDFDGNEELTKSLLTSLRQTAIESSQRRGIQSSFSM